MLGGTQIIRVRVSSSERNIFSDICAVRNGAQINVCNALRTCEEIVIKLLAAPTPLPTYAGLL